MLLAPAPARALARFRKQPCLRGIRAEPAMGVKLEAKIIALSAIRVPNLDAVGVAAEAAREPRLAYSWV